MQVAVENKIDGIVAYSSDPAAPTAAYVANKLGLQGMDYNVVRHFCEKNLFREFLKEHGFNVPASLEVTEPYQPAEEELNQLRMPVIVKPTDSSGSKGIAVLYDLEHVQEALQEAKKYSRNGTLIIEEFIQRDHPYVIEAEVFAVRGKVCSWGLINSIRDTASNPLLPAAYSYPLDLPQKRKEIVRKEVSKLVAACGNVSGAFNIEMIIDKNDELFFLDAGPRNGGNMLPEFISMISGKNMVEATVKTAMGESGDLDIELDGESGGFWGLGVLHASKDGMFEGVEYSEQAQKALIREEINKKPGDSVSVFMRCTDLVGLSFFRFETKEQMDQVMCNGLNTMRVKMYEN